MDRTHIEWTDATWNPVTGCSKVSPGCANCYAARMARRLQATGTPRYARGFSVATHPDALHIPLEWSRPRMVFVNSMSDLFHEEVPDSFIRDVFDVMGLARQHVFQVLTKRDERLRTLGSELPWHGNVWVGVSVETAAQLARLDNLRRVDGAVRFASFEPLLGPLGTIDLTGLGWIIVGGESGPGARPMLHEWAAGVRDQCLDAGVPFFFKQWGGPRRKRAGRLLDGQEWSQIPTLAATAHPPVASAISSSAVH